MQAGVKAAIRTTVKAAVVAVNAPMGKARLRRKLQRTERPLWVELGAVAPRKGWVPTNYNWRTRYVMDAAQPWPVETGSVDFVFADNVIEHLTLEQGRAALRNAHAAMCPGGTIRLATPDIGRAVRLYLGEDEEAAASVMRMHRRHDRVAEHAVDLLRIPFAEFGHHLGYLYDEASLSAELKRAGFHDIRRCETGESAHPELQDLENRLDEESIVQLILEAEA